MTIWRHCQPHLDLAVSSRAVARLGLLPKSWVCLWVDVGQKMQPSQRTGEGRSYYLQQVRRTLGIFPKEISLAFNLFSRYKETFPLNLIMIYSSLIKYTFITTMEIFFFLFFFILKSCLTRINHDSKWAAQS